MEFIFSLKLFSSEALLLLLLLIWVLLLLLLIWVCVWVIYMCECVQALVVMLHEEDRGPCWMSLLSTLFSETGFLTQARAHQFGEGGRPLSSREPPVSTSPALEFRHVPLCLFFFFFNMGTADLNFHFKHSTTYPSPHSLHGAFDGGRCSMYVSCYTSKLMLTVCGLSVLN